MITFTKVRDVKTPTRGTKESAGLDFYVPNDYTPCYVDRWISPGQSVNIPSGIKMVIPSGYAGIFFNKSGVAIKGLQVGACVVDSDYRGEIHLNVHNHSDKEVMIEAGQKLVQMLIMPIELTNLVELTNEDYNQYSDTERGIGGFGSTGSK